MWTVLSQGQFFPAVVLSQYESSEKLTNHITVSMKMKLSKNVPFISAPKVVTGFQLPAEKSSYFCSLGELIECILLCPPQPARMPDCLP